MKLLSVRKSGAFRVHFCRNVFSRMPRGRARMAVRMLKTIHAPEDLSAARYKAQAVIAKLGEMRLARAAALVEAQDEETFVYYRLPAPRWRRIRTNNPLERIIRENRRRTRVVGAFPAGESALMLVAARLRHIATTKWGTGRYPKDGVIEGAARD